MRAAGSSEGGGSVRAGTSRGAGGWGTWSSVAGGTRRQVWGVEKAPRPLPLPLSPLPGLTAQPGTDSEHEAQFVRRQILRGSRLGRRAATELFFSPCCIPGTGGAFSSGFNCLPPSFALAQPKLSSCLFFFSLLLATLPELPGARPGAARQRWELLRDPGAVPPAPASPPCRGFPWGAGTGDGPEP